MNVSRTPSTTAAPPVAAPEAFSPVHAELTKSVFCELRDLGVEIPNPGEVAEFLVPFPDFLPRLPEICRIVREVADAETSHLSLEVWTSVEEGDSMLTLWLHRPTPQPGFNDILDCKLDAQYEWMAENDTPFNVNLAFPRRSNSIAGF